MSDKQEQQKQSLIVRARKYYEGEQEVPALAAQKEWLEEHNDTLIAPRTNYCAIVVNTMLERLEVAGLHVFSGGKRLEDAEKTLADVWQKAKLDAFQKAVMRAASVDGIAYALVDWDAEKQEPVFHRFPQFVARENGGDDTGMNAIFPDGDYTRQPLAVERYFFAETKNGRVWRKTVYYPDRIERLQYEAGGWEPIADTERAIEPNVDRNGMPLGIPVAVFTNPAMRSDLKDIMPLQDAADKVWLDMLAVSDLSAYPAILAAGWSPRVESEEGGEKFVRAVAGTIYSTPDNGAHAYNIPFGNLDKLLQTEERIVARIASIGHIPLNRFTITKLVASADTLREQENALMAKVRERRVLYGNAFETMAKIILRFYANFTGKVAWNDASVRVIWASPVSMPSEREVNTGAMKHERLLVPLETVWAELGYTQEQIDAFKQTEEYKAAQGARQAMTEGVPPLPFLKPEMPNDK